MFKYLNKDIPASIVVFFVALPLCLGIALASGAPAFSGLIAGIIGGVVVGAISGSQLGVSGPAAGLAVIVLGAIATLGFDQFLVAVVIGGALQILLGILRAGVIGYYFPSAVIKGMLAGIGIIIFLKQIPHAFGYDKDYEGELEFFQSDGENTFSELINMLDYISPGAVIVTIISLIILLLWENVLSKKHKIFTIIPGPLVAVVFGVVYAMLMQDTSLEIAEAHLVKVPVPESLKDFGSQFTFPDFSAISNMKVWVTGVTIAIVASLETLLCVEAADKLDPHKRVTPTNRELLAQGTGNIISGLIGGLPITQVIVRSSANIQSGARTKVSAILHGIFILISVVTIPVLLNKIPLAVLAAILFVVGYKLAKPSLFKHMYKLGKAQFLPFVITIIGIVFTDLLIGIGLGLAVGIITILLNSYKNSHFLHKEKFNDINNKFKMNLAEEVTFLNKGAINRELHNLPKNAYLELDVTKTKWLDYDIVEILDEFAIRAKEKNITIQLISQRGTVENPTSYKVFFEKEKKEII
ncbi:SulP family inorganic anion transporter [Mesonia aestuariivivens]|uniref:SulP family inorganic anion transporter n=1 Tax=Mesonia aestuariivivens TaxID=2796128 RepID=A0ABS6VXE3_9FLAO|nr:SulP family inorganic anion transporter [Mesonia aestuariivivens]MBW2960258.1 SulP family inorganic anion transporter [Mesonia aestuariivivens]